MIKLLCQDSLSSMAGSSSAYRHLGPDRLAHRGTAAVARDTVAVVVPPHDTVAAVVHHDTAVVVAAQRPRVPEDGGNALRFLAPRRGNFRGDSSWSEARWLRMCLG